MPLFKHSQRFLSLLIGLCPLLTAHANPSDFPNDTPWPTIDSGQLEELSLVVRENLFDRTHFVIESSCRVTPFERPLDFLDSQVTARWTQSVLLQIEPAKNSNFIIDLGLGYSLERSTHSTFFGEIVSNSIEPAILLPVSLAYGKSSSYGLSESYLQFEWEINPYIFSRTTTLFHRLVSLSTESSSSSLTLYGREKTSSFSPLDNDFYYKFHQVGFILEHQTY